MPIFYSNQNEFGLTWEDWCDTSRKKLALRHVTERNQAEQDRTDTIWNTSSCFGMPL